MNMAKTEHHEPYHVPIAWCKDYGQGKAFYISLGHDESVWANPKYQECLLGAVKWILNLEPGDATPNPELTKAQEAKAKSDDAIAREAKAKADAAVRAGKN
jgi:type 1 glutamine amidotransferase